jgi:two-component system OmpR family response regulator
MRVLLISPSDGEAAYLHKALRESAHSLQATNDFRDGLHLASNEPFDAVVMVALDADLTASVEALLPQFGHLPALPAILVVVGGAVAADRVRMLRSGADACFVHPYSFIEMHERLLALHRVSGRHGVECEPVASLRLDIPARELVEGTKRLRLSKRELLLIECLLRQLNAPVARDHLIRYAWPDNDAVDPSSVNIVVSRLRRKFEACAFTAQLETISRFGYQLKFA